MAKSLHNVEQLFIGAAATATITATNPTLQGNSMNAGEIGIFTPDGLRVVESGAGTGQANALTTNDFIIAQYRGATAEPKFLVSGVINKSKVTKATRLVYTAATEQVDYIGYNGVSGSIEVNANELYYIQLYLEDYITSSNDGRYIKHGQFNSNSTSVEADIANGLRLSLINNFSREPKQLIKFEVVNAHAGTANGTAADTVAGTLGSKVVTITDGSGASLAYSVGDYFRAGTAVTSPVYKVVASTKVANTTGTITLDVPLQAAVALAGDTSEQITSAQALANSFGLKLTGVAQPWVLERKFYRKVRWTANLSEDAFGATVVTKSVGASEGSGEGEQVAEMEAFFNRSFGEEYRIGQPNIFPMRQDAVVATNYDIINLVYSQDEVGHGFVANISPKVIAIALPETAPNYAVTGTANDITDVLEVLIFGSANGNLAIS